jgi:2-polyprenyl-3-methyl-5-hydroxy-6-metoxy-1,4-benzoquinol methylase
MTVRFRHKKDWVVPLVAGKAVLDLGCVDNSLENTRKTSWLHRILCQHASSVLGVDILEDAVATLRKEGFDVVCADIESMKLNRRFDIVVAGDVIEHLSNVGAFLQRIREHLSADGSCLVTTPNPITLIRFLKLLIVDKVGANIEHTCWFTRSNMRELARRHGFQVEKVVYIDDIYDSYALVSWIRRLLILPLLVLNYAVCALRPQMSETYGYVLKKFAP